MCAFKLPMLVEPVPVIDDFVQGIACIERVGPCARFVLFSNQTMHEVGVPTRVIVRKIIMPIEALPLAIQQASDFVAIRAFSNVFKLRG